MNEGNSPFSLAAIDLTGINGLHSSDRRAFWEDASLRLLLGTSGAPERPALRDGRLDLRVPAKSVGIYGWP